MLKSAYQPVLFNMTSADAALPNTEKPQIVAALS